MMGFVTDTAAADLLAEVADPGPMDALLASNRAAMVDAERPEDLLALERARCRLDHEQLVQIDLWDARSVWAGDCSASGAAWLAPRLGITGAQARERVKVARWCRRAPAVLAALLACRLTYSKVVVFTRLVTEGCWDAFERDGEMLVRHASELRVEDVTRLLRHWATYADPDAAMDDEQARQDQRAVYLAETFGGMGDLKGNLTPEGLAMAEALLHRVMEELYRDEARGDIPTRTVPQRRHDAFLEILRRAAAWDPQNGKQAHPTLLFLLGEDAVATTDDGAERTADGAGLPLVAGEPRQASGDGDAVILEQADLSRREAGGDSPSSEDAEGSAGAPSTAATAPTTDPGGGPAGLGEHTGDSGRPADGRPGRGRGDPVGMSPPPRFLFSRSAKATTWDGPPITNETARRIACDADLARIVLGADSEILDHGRTRRLFTPPQRRAILARFGFRCGWPDCYRPAGWLQIHHRDEWIADEGPTNVDNGWPGCRTHHHAVHEGGCKILEDPVSGQLTYWRADGTQVLPANPNTALFDA
jgi:hypothetical protein